MERIQTLIEKLYQQKQQGCSPSQLLLTVQLLQSELIKLQQGIGSIGTAKVAVTMPVNYNFSQEHIRVPEVRTEAVQAIEKVLEIQPESATLINSLNPSFSNSAQGPELILQKEYELREPIHKEFATEEKADVFNKMHQVLNPAFSDIAESPTLVQHQEQKEIHQVIAQPKESLNDRLKQEKKEVVSVLKDTPLKDLRKGIGINDRFTFVNELFRGDEVMYERSIKTINGFHILSEAEYWINRELKFKLGWNDNKETVQQFYQLVRRRFS